MRRRIFINLAVDLVLFGAIYYLLLVKQGSRFESASMVGDWNRIPLWRPHEIVAFDNMDIRLHNWYAWNTPIDDKIIVYEKDRPDLETIALQKLKDIETLSVGTGVVCGIRHVLAQPFGGNLGKRYFVFATNQVEVSYFKDKSEFLAECSKYGIDGTDLKRFQDCWTEYWYEREILNPFVLLWKCLKSGLTIAESLLGLILILVIFVVVRKQWSRSDSCSDNRRFTR